MNNLSAINLLIHAGADVNLCGADGVTALEVACEFNFSFIDLLISKGAKVTGRVITAAFKNKKYEVVEKFLFVRCRSLMRISSCHRRLRRMGLLRFQKFIQECECGPTLLRNESVCGLFLLKFH